MKRQNIGALQILLYRPAGHLEMILPLLFMLVLGFSILPLLAISLTYLGVLIPTGAATSDTLNSLFGLGIPWIATVPITSFLGIYFSIAHIKRVTEHYRKLITKGDRVVGKINYVGFFGFTKHTNVFWTRPFDYKIVYEYTYKGKKYHTFKVFLLQPGFRRLAERKFSEGKKINLIVDPNNPGHSLISDYFSR